MRATRNASLTDQAYELLKWKILSMEIGPGAYLNELELCEQLGFKRAPIHHALQRLKHDSLVDILPRKGVVVRALSRDDIEFLIEARLPIECDVARHAARRASKSECRSLEKLLATGRRLIEANDREALIKLDRSFHNELAKMARNPVLADLVEHLHQRSTLLWHLSVSDKATYAEVQKQHQAILDSVKAKDPDAAAEAVKRHLTYFSRN